MASATVKTLQEPLIAASHDEEKGIKDASGAPCLLTSSGAPKGHVNKTSGAPCVDEENEEKKRLQAVSIWCSVLCFWAHVSNAVVASTISYIPYVGESPAWLRAVILISNLVLGGIDHLSTCMSTSTHSKLDNLWKAMLVPSLLGTIFSLSKLCTVRPVEESTSLVFVFLVLLVSPGVVYTKATGKEAPSTHSEIMDSFSTWAGIALHSGVDVAFAIYFVFCWKLVGSPLLMGWLL